MLSTARYIQADGDGAVEILRFVTIILGLLHVTLLFTSNPSITT